MEPYHIQFTAAAYEAFDRMPQADKELFAKRVFLVLQTRPHRGDAAFEVFPSPSTPGLFHLTFGSSIVSYAIDPSSRIIRVSEFSY